jgi:hypothetical protein
MFLLGALFFFSVDFFSVRCSLKHALKTCQLDNIHFFFPFLKPIIVFFSHMNASLQIFTLQRKWVANERERVCASCRLDSCNGKGKRELCIWRGMTITHVRPNPNPNPNPNSLSSNLPPRPKVKTKRRWHKSFETIHKDQRPSLLKRPWKAKRPDIQCT